MKVTIQSPQHSVSAKLNNYIQKKLDKLELFYDRIIRAEVFLKVVNSSEKVEQNFRNIIAYSWRAIGHKKRSLFF